MRTIKQKRAQEAKRVPVVSIGQDGKRTRYASMKEAAQAIGANVSQISKAVNFGDKVHGMKWERE